MQRDVLRLAGLMAAVALATTRVGLLFHELVGHGGTALALGGTITRVRLHWFGGGWIRYDLPSSDAAVIATGFGGIAVEIVLGIAVWAAVRGPGLPRLLARTCGLVLVAHGASYLATGSFAGYGDGIVLYRALGDARVALAIAAGLVACVATYVGARAVTRPLLGTLPGPLRRRALGFAVATLLAGGLHAGLTIGELALAPDATYTRLLRTERDRQIAIELSTWTQQQASRATTPQPAEIRAQRIRLEDSHPTFPFAIVLSCALLLALIAGMATSRSGRDERITNVVLVRAVVLAVGSIALVIALGLVLPG